MADRRRERGQILVIFVIAMVAIIGMIGIVLDGGSAFAQRRDEQNVADLASVAGATAYLNTSGGTSAKVSAAEAAARSVATANGYTSDATSGVDVDVTVTPTAFYANVKVQVTKPHRNNFAGVLGMPTWDVSTEATSQASDRPNGAVGAMPLLFNEEAFPGAICDESAGGCVPEVYQLPGTGNEDVPQDATQFNWTVFCTASGNECNANARDVKDLIDNNGTSTTVYLNDDIGPFDAGTKTTLFDDLEPHVGEVFPVPIVDDEGQMVGWAYFRLTSIEGAPDKVIKGYFVSPVNADQLVVNQSGGTASLTTGVYVVRMID